MKKLVLSILSAMMLVAAVQSEAVAAPVVAAPAPALVHKSSVEPARWVTRCHRWRHHHHWHRACHRVHI